MDYFSCLGPIDPQIVKEGKLVPALSYLKQYQDLVKKSENGKLSTAEYALLSKLDLGELHQFEQARTLTNKLIIQWLSTYKFKNWKKTETRKTLVTGEMKQQRAKEIARKLGDIDTWHSHGRGIGMDTLQDDLNLRVEDFSSIAGFSILIRDYLGLIKDYMTRQEIYSFVHTNKGDRNGQGNPEGGSPG